MSWFSTFDRLEQIEPGGTRYVLRDALLWRVGKADSDYLLIIPARTEFDLSVPRWLHWLLSPHDRIWLPAAAIHDELLRRGFDPAFAAGEFRRAVSARVARAIQDGLIRRDRRVWPAFYGVLIWTTIKH